MRSWLPPLLRGVGNGAGLLLLLVGMYYDHQHMPPGWITIAAIGLLCGPELREAGRAWALERAAPPVAQPLPEVQAALRMMPLYREHGGAVFLELEELLARRALKRGGNDVGG